jgi:hypothetical protein
LDAAAIQIRTGAVQCPASECRHTSSTCTGHERGDVIDVVGVVLTGRSEHVQLHRVAFGEALKFE